MNYLNCHRTRRNTSENGETVTKQIARISTGGKAPRREIAEKAALEGLERDKVLKLQPHGVLMKKHVYKASTPAG